MLTAKIANYAIIFIFIFERMLELLVNQINKKIMINKYSAKIISPSESFQMKTFHTLWFLSLLVETHTMGQMLSGFRFYICLILLIIAQTLRWSAIYTLGSNWSIDVYEAQEHPIIENGPYAYMRHPNYLAVILEFTFLPLLLGCYFTLFFGSIANFFFLKRRIKLEEKSLENQFYNSKFNTKKRFLYF